MSESPYNIALRQKLGNLKSARDIYSPCQCIICYFRSTGQWPEAPTESAVEMAAVDGFQTVGSTDVNVNGAPGDGFFLELPAQPIDPAVFRTVIWKKP